MDIKCPICGSGIIESGRLQGEGLCFLPAHAKGLASKSELKIDAFACCNCGHLILQVDAEALVRKIDLPTEHQ